MEDGWWGWDKSSGVLNKHRGRNCMSWCNVFLSYKTSPKATQSLPVISDKKWGEAIKETSEGITYLVLPQSTHTASLQPLIKCNLRHPSVLRPPLSSQCWLSPIHAHPSTGAQFFHSLFPVTSPIATILHPWSFSFHPPKILFDPRFTPVTRSSRFQPWEYDILPPMLCSPFPSPPVCSSLILLLYLGT